VIQSLKSIGGSLADVAQEELALSQPSSDPNPMQQVLFSDEVVQSYGSRCLDGSASGYYIRENKQSTQWVVYLQGGQWLFVQSVYSFLISWIHLFLA
jgi:hypothetical protein